MLDPFCFTILSLIHFSLLTLYYKSSKGAKLLFQHFAKKNPQLNVQFHHLLVLPSNQTLECKQNSAMLFDTV
jgi:hypothetical protein